MVEEEQPQKSNLAWRGDFYGESIGEAKKSAEKIAFWHSGRENRGRKKLLKSELPRRANRKLGSKLYWY